MSRLFLVAGEASGDVLGGRLIPALRARDPDLRLAGIGGPRMAEQGVPSLFPIRELALMGLLEVLPSIRRLARRLDEAEAAIIRFRPDALVTIDSPGFTLRLAARIRPRGIPVVHYVAPQIWAWRPGRVAKIRARVDRLLCLLPFEPPIFEAAGIAARFVGHPVLEAGIETGDAARFRARHGIAPEERVLLVMPGSRPGEIRRMLPVFGDAIDRLLASHPGLRPVLPVGHLVADAVAAGVAGWASRPILVGGMAEKHDAFAAASLGLVKSGTSSLEMAVAGVPHLVAYRVNPITAAIVRRLVRVRFASLVNLLADRALVPEHLQEAATAPALAEGLAALLAGGGAAQREGFGEVLSQLRPSAGLPSEAAAAAILDALRR
jgi:lipid-A-disaccharide synthase